MVPYVAIPCTDGLGMFGIYIVFCMFLLKSGHPHLGLTIPELLELTQLEWSGLGVALLIERRGKGGNARHWVSKYQDLVCVKTYSKSCVFFLQLQERFIILPSQWIPFCW